MMGPNPIKKKGAKCKNESQRDLNTAGVGSSMASSGAMSAGTGSPSAMGESRISGEGWNRRRYQREDEALWGLHEPHWPTQKIKDAISKASETAGRILEGRLSRTSPTDEESQGTYLPPSRNPPVNDLHPPVVSTRPASKAETAWMLQPPPSAKIMEGKVRVESIRSRADSNASSRVGVNNTPLGRKLTERMVDSKLQRGETPSFPELRPTSSRAISGTTGATGPKTSNSTLPTLPSGQRHTRSDSFSSLSSFEDARPIRKPAPIAISKGDRSPRQTLEHISIPSDPTTSRPRLETIASSSKIIPKVDDTLPLRELPSSSSTLNSRAPSPSKGPREPMKLPPLATPGNKPFIFPPNFSENDPPSTEA